MANHTTLSSYAERARVALETKKVLENGGTYYAAAQLCAAKGLTIKGTAPSRQALRCFWKDAWSAWSEAEWKTASTLVRSAKGNGLLGKHAA